MSATNGTLDSSLRGAIAFIAKDFNVTSELQLPISTYLIGFIIEPVDH